jgi:hypothetical protein
MFSKVIDNLPGWPGFFRGMFVIDNCFGVAGSHRQLKRQLLEEKRRRSDE